jgi:hypothetical protein
MEVLLARLLKRIALIAGLVGAFVSSGAVAEERVNLTVRQLFDQNHRIEVPAGSEVVWADPHFERVWFPGGSGAPAVERVFGGFRARFAAPGTYRGAFTVVGGHGTSDVYNLVVVVGPSTR